MDDQSSYSSSAAIVTDTSTGISDEKCPLNFAENDQLMKLGHGIKYRVTKTYDMARFSKEQGHRAWRVEFEAGPVVFVTRLNGNSVCQVESEFHLILQDLIEKHFAPKRQ